MVAEWLASKGITAFLLKYRLVNTGATDKEFQKALIELFMQIGNATDPANADNPYNNLSQSEGMADINALGQEDGRQAVRVVRDGAAEWGVDPEKIGIMGFSAGGMVTLGTLMGNDPASRPDFAGTIYTPWSGQTVPDNAPPVFILAAADDGIASKGSIEMYRAWKAVGKEAELHMYSKGGHGFGMQQSGLPVDSWIERFYDWMKSII